MKYDKRNGNVVFYEDTHKYVDLDTNITYISVTTLIEKFGQPFDKEFWSAYKALERILTKEQFSMEKKNLLASRKINKKYLMDMYEFNEDTFNKHQQDILDEWQKKNIESCERGTKIHADLEHSITDKKITTLPQYGVGGKFVVNTNESLMKDNTELLNIEKGVFPEYLIYFNTPDGEFKLAGQIDLLIKDGNDIYIFDYKGLPLDTKIPTLKGWSTIADLNVNDVIFDKNGEPTKILHKSEIHNNPCFKIIFDNGDSIVADHEHKWEVSFISPNKKVKDVVMTTEELFKYINNINIAKRTSYNIPRIYNCKPINTPEQDLLIDPYVLGAWLGDGSKDCGLITQSKNSPLWNEIIKRGYEIGENSQHSLDREGTEMRTVYGLRTLLKKENLLNNKHIPDIYLRGSFSQRLDLLRGFMDTDGYYNPGRKRFVMSTGQEWQKDDLIKLLSSLGIKCSTFAVTKKCGSKEFQAWDICFSTSDFNPFLIRNQNILLDNFKYDKRTFRTIKNVEKTETVPTQCLEVDSPTHTFLCTENCIVTHNTNSKIDDKSFFDSRTKKNQMMLYPLNNLMDCNKLHYTLQLSTYAYMLQKLNPAFNVKRLCLIHYDHDGNVTEYPLDYLRDDVIRMCKWYKKEQKRQALKDSRKPIIF